MIKYTVGVDMVPGGIRTTIPLNQYDSDFEIDINLFASRGAFSVPAGTTATIRGTKSDGNGYDQTVVVDDTTNTVTVTGDVQMTAVAGRSVFEVTLTHNDKVLHTANFDIVVERTALDRDTISSDSRLRQFAEVYDDYADEIITAGAQYAAYKAEMDELEEAATAAAESTAADAAAVRAARQSFDTANARAQSDLESAAETAIATIDNKAEAVAAIVVNSDTLARQALSAAGNAENDTAELGTIVSALQNNVRTLSNASGAHLADLTVINGALYGVNEDGDIIAGPIEGISGGGGGSGSAATSVISLSNTSGFNAKAIAASESCVLSISWSSVADEMPTGDGTLTIMVNGVTKSVQNIHQGAVSVDVTDYLISGSNTVRLTVRDNQDNARFTTFNITKVELSINSSFDASTVFTGAFSFPYTPVGAVQKTVYVVVDGVIVDTVVTSVSGRQMSSAIPAQSHGAHTIECFFTADVNGQTVQSNRLYYEVTCTEMLNNSPIITSSFAINTVSQYSLVIIPFRVYVPGSATGDISIYLNNVLVSEQTVDQTEQTYSFRANTTGTNTVRIVCGTSQKAITLSVTESEVDVEAATEALALHMTAQGRSNNESTRAVWQDEDGNITATMTGFNWKQDGWLTDDNGVDVLRLEGDARVTIPYQVFAADCKTTGKTIEIEFATRQVSDYSANILSCYSDGIGLNITPQSVTFSGAQNSIDTLYKDGEHIRLSITVDKQTENRLILIYINAVMSRAIQYASGERFSQLSPVGISIGSSDCGIDIYGIRVYDNNLSRVEILDNWIADCSDGPEMLARFSHNNVYDEYGRITTANLPSDLPYFILEAPELPQYKGDKKNISGSYVDPVYTNRSFTFEGCQINVQGTSSAPYYRKNYDMQFKGGFITNAGTVENYALETNSIPFNRFVLKADVASSESANNTGLTMYYNDTCPYKTPEMLADSRVRWGIEGHPIVVFWYNPDTGETQFMGKYNFNLPKRAPEPYGYSGNDESWEVERNNSDNVKFQDDDLATLAWDELNQVWYPAWYDDFEARFPSDEWRDTSKLQEFLSWVKSTDRSQATGDSLASPVTYILGSSVTVDGYSSDNTFTVVDEISNGVATGNKIMTFTADTPAYRLTKFKAEAPDRVEMESAYFYYLFTELFLMIDSRAKNMFFGFHGSPVTLSGSALERKVVFEPYDMDTAIGTNNSGVLMFGPALEDTDTVSSVISGSGGGSNAPVFNGQDSVFWVNLRDSSRSELTTMYRNLRSGVWSYNAIESRYENHQSKWPEAIFNEDAWVKYIVPLVDPVTVDDSTGQLIRTDRYLTMLQGSKEEQRKWWLRNRFRYMDSKFVTGDASNNIINMRVFNSGTLTLKSAIDLYVGVSFGGGTTVAYQRTTANTAVSFPYAAQSGVTEMETWIYSADLITDVGDLSVFYPNELDFSKATRLKRLKIGSAVSGYSNANLRTLDVRNSELLEHIDCRNCPNLNITVNLEGSPRLKEAYFDGTSVTGVDLVDGGALETLHLPATITTLTLLNLSKLTDLTVASYANVSRLMLANMDDSVVDIVSILQAIHANSQVYIEGLNMEAEDAQEIEEFLDLLDTMTGVTRERNASGEWLYHDYETAQVSGRIHTSALTGAQIASYNTRYPYIRITADHVTSYLTYKSYDGSSTIKTVTCIDGVPQETAPSGPARSQTAQYSYTFVGWNTQQDAQAAESGCTTNVVADRTVYAAYSRTTRTYTVTWKNSDGTVLETDTNVPYGTTPTYNGATPTYNGQTSRGWTPAISSVSGDIIYTASYIPTYSVRFYNGSTLLDTISVEEHSAAVYTGTTPVNSDPDLVFSGWDVDLTDITANTDAHAVFTDNSDPVVKYLKATIDNYESDTATSIATYAFDRQTALTAATTSATSIASYAFANCTALETVDLTNTSACTIAANAFSGCEKLESLIIRSSTVSTLSATSALTGSRIAKGLGGIYVPAGLVNSYKSATNWSTYANNIYPISEYPKSDYSTISDTWEQIFAAEADGTYSSKYHVGDTKSVSVYNTTMYMQIAAIDTDVLSDGTGNAKITWLCKSILTTHNMNSSNVTTGGWPTTAMRSWLLSDVLTTLPTVVQNNIKTVDKTYYDYGSSSTATSTDTIWIPSYREVLGGTSAESSGAVYSSIFTNSTARIKFNSSGASRAWYLRSANNGTTFHFVNDSGSTGISFASNGNGVVFGFCT